MKKTYRTGATGALLDVYEAAILDLINAISALSNTSLYIITDPHTQDENCRSIQTVLTHVVHAGFGYAISIYNMQGHHTIRPNKAPLSTVQQYQAALQELFLYTEKVFASITDADLEQLEEMQKMLTGWGQRYDVEQLMEHAVVHLLRHRRQIEKMKLCLPNG